LRNSFRDAQNRLEPVDVITAFAAEGKLDKNIRNQDAQRVSFESLMETGVFDPFEKRCGDLFIDFATFESPSALRDGHD